MSNIKRKAQRIAVSTIASTEMIDFDAWLDRYARAIVEATETKHARTTEAA